MVLSLSALPPGTSDCLLELHGYFYLFSLCLAGSFPIKTTESKTPHGRTVSVFRLSYTRVLVLDLTPSDSCLRSRFDRLGCVFCYVMFVSFFVSLVNAGSMS